VLSAPAVLPGDDINPLLIKVAKVLGKVVPGLPGQKLSSASISRDPAVVKAYDEDPLNYRGALPAGIGGAMLRAFLAPADEGGVAELHVVFTQFVNMVSQTPRVIRLLPLEVVEGVEPAGETEVLPLYEFEPSPEAVLDALLPMYVRSRIHSCLLQAAASELAARQRAMHTATENAEDLVRMYTRLANQARQAEITQEISEIVSGADALASS